MQNRICPYCGYGRNYSNSSRCQKCGRSLKSSAKVLRGLGYGFSMTVVLLMAIYVYDSGFLSGDYQKETPKPVAVSSATVAAPAAAPAPVPDAKPVPVAVPKAEPLPPVHDASQPPKKSFMENLKAFFAPYNGDKPAVASSSAPVVAAVPVKAQPPKPAAKPQPKPAPAKAVKPVSAPVPVAETAQAPKKSFMDSLRAFFTPAKTEKPAPAASSVVKVSTQTVKTAKVTEPVEKTEKPLPVKEPKTAVKTVEVPEVPAKVQPKAEAPVVDAGMARVAGGDFVIGSAYGDSDEKPLKKVYVDDFSMDRTEVTVSAYAACVKAGKCSKPSGGSRCNWGNDKAGYPINCVSWKQAKSYCSYAGKKLPTEAQWEKAARGGAHFTYSFGNAPAALEYNAWYGSNASGVTHKVAGKRANGYGLYDMHGNVREWTEDAYTTDYASLSEKNPVSKGGGARVVRGCSAVDNQFSCRTAKRFMLSPSDGSEPMVGFRCAR